MAGYSYGTPYGDVRVDISDVTANLAEFNVKTKKALRKYLEQDACPMLESYMQANRPWQDRTSTARIGLTASVEKSGALTRDDYELRVKLSHTAYNERGQAYGAYLEYASGGFDSSGKPIGHGVKNFRSSTGYNKPYSILAPTAILKGADVLNGMRGVVERYYY